MKRDAVQHERAPRCGNTNFHNYPVGFGQYFPTALPLHIQGPSILDTSRIASGQNPYLQHGLLYPTVFGTLNKTICFEPNGLQFQPKHGGEQSLNSNSSRQMEIVKDDEVTSSEESNTKLERNGSAVEKDNRKLNLDMPPLHEKKSSQISSLSLFPAENVYESAAKLLFLSIKWARTIPSFLQLSYRDQAILLEESWSELFVLTAAQWALPVDEALLVSNAMAPTNRHSALEEDARRLREIISRLTLLRVDHTEHACLKALVLFKPESRGLCEPTHIELLQDQTHVMLNDYCAQSKSTHKGRFGKLLLTLPAVQAVTRQGLEELLFKQTVGDVAIDRLLGDLAKVTNN